MYMFNKIVATAVGALISLINETEYETSTEIYDGGDNVIGYKNFRILITSDCLIRLYTVIPYENNLNNIGTCEITTTSKDGAETGSMMIRVEVDDINGGFKSPVISFTTDAIADNILDSSGVIVDALKTII